VNKTEETTNVPTGGQIRCIDTSYLIMRFRTAILRFSATEIVLERKKIIFLDEGKVINKRNAKLL
jgi:hypothetical protein